MSVRKIPRNGGSITGRVARYGEAGSVGHESFLEHDFIFLFHHDPEVARVEEQPVRISYEAPGTSRNQCQRHYVPDFLVTYHDWAKRLPLLVEVKYCAYLEAKRDELLPKIKAGQRYARQRGWRYRVYTEKHIRTPLLTNIKFLLPYRRFARDEARCCRLLDTLTTVQRTYVNHLLEACSDRGDEERGRYIACLWWLLSTGELAADLALPLSMSTELWRREQPPRH